MQNKEQQMAHNRLNGLTQKQTAVIQLLKYILVDCRNENGNIQFHANETFNRFLEMEKQQIIDAITIGFDEGRSYMHNGTTKFETGLQYYNETFKSK